MVDSMAEKGKQVATVSPALSFSLSYFGDRRRACSSAVAGWRKHSHTLSAAVPEGKQSVSQTVLLLPILLLLCPPLMCSSTTAAAVGDVNRIAINERELQMKGIAVSE